MHVMVLIDIEILKNQINKKWINKNYLKRFRDCGP